MNTRIIRHTAKQNLDRAIDPHTGIANLTTLAEETAIDLGHAEWLDDPDHAVWEIVVEVAEAKGGLA